MWALPTAPVEGSAHTMGAAGKQVMGWIAVALSTLVASFWAYWGANETFHEGWYYRDWIMNVAMTLAQYLSPMLVLVAAAFAGVAWPRAGASLHLALAAIVGWWFGFRAAVFFLVPPLVVLGGLYYYGRPQPRRLALAAVLVIPLLTMLTSGAYPAYLASQRFDDGDYGSRLIEGNEVRLVWAPEGPGWPDSGVSWEEAHHNCQYLDEEGKNLAGETRNIWRLPTVDEAVRSSVRKGSNAGGAWNPQTGTATYQMQPNKDSPLWKTYSKVIYWWTGTEVDNTAYRIVWNGQVHAMPKKVRWGYLAYRCVRNPGPLDGK
ncbi:MAG: DUF1566 domain-containing protein [Acidobacteria bacterium]|nr:DUF1566 domain-containing protein [Acidobacteriota bacterium]